MLQEYEKFPNWLIDVEEGKIWSKRLNRFLDWVSYNGYVIAKYNGYKQRHLHQYIWMTVNGDIPEGYQIHHIDGDKSNNSIYNLTLIEQSKHIAIHNKEHKRMLGKHHSEESKNKMSESHKGKILSEDTKEKISNTMKGKVPNNKGKHRSEETKKKISETQINNPKLSKQVAQYTLDGELVKVWDSISETGRNNFNFKSVCACCQGKRNTHKGYKWKYYEGTN